MNTEITRHKLKESKYFNLPKKNQKILIQNNSNLNSYLLTEQESNKNINDDINNYFTSRKINVKKKLKQNKTEFILPNVLIEKNAFTQKNINKMNKTFYKVNSSFNKTKSFSDFSEINKSKNNNISLYNKLYKSNCSSHMTQTSESFFHKNNNNYNSNNNNKLQKIKNLRLNNSFNDNKSNIITYAQYHINQLLSKKKSSSKNKFIQIKTFKRENTFLFNMNNGMNSYYNTSNNFIKNNEGNKSNINDKKEMNINEKMNTSGNKFHINKIYFEDELEKLIHKIIIIKNNKKEFENFVMSLTSEELQILYKNKDILPFLLKNKDNLNLSTDEKIKIKEEKKHSDDYLKNIIFQNQLINLFLKNSKKSFSKTNFRNLKTTFSYKSASEKNNNIDNYDNNSKEHYIDKEKEKEINNKRKNSNKIYKYKNINIISKDDNNNEKNLLKNNDLLFLGFKNKINYNLNNKLNKAQIKKDEILWEKWFNEVLDKNKNSDKNINNDNNNDNNEEIIIDKSEEEFRKIIIKKLIRQNSSKIINNNIKRKNSLLIEDKDIIDSKNKNNKSEIINKDRVFEKIKNKFSIEIFNYINTPQGKLDLKLIFNSEEKINLKSNQKTNKILLESFKPKKSIKIKNKIILNPIPDYIIREDTKKTEVQKDQHEEKDDESKENNDNYNKNENLENNLNEIPISLKEFFLEKYKINEKGRYSRLILHTEEKKMNKNKAKKKISIKKGIHNIKIINKYKKNNIKIKKISKINNKNNSNSNKKIKEDNNKKTSTQNSNIDIINNPVNNKNRIINIFGLNIEIRKGLTPLENLESYMLKKGLNSEELKNQVKLKNKIDKLINKLQILKKKKYRRRKTIINNKKLSQILDINYNYQNLLNIANNGKNMNSTEQKKSKFFDGNLSREEIEKRKMKLLLKFKNDIEYKAMTGDIDEAEINMFSKLEERLEKLMDLINVNEYVGQMESIIGEFQEEINMREKSRKDEKRINGFIEKLVEDIDSKMNKKNYMDKIFGKVINFDIINHINDLNKI